MGEQDVKIYILEFDFDNMSGGIRWFSDVMKISRIMIHDNEFYEGFQRINFDTVAIGMNIENVKKNEEYVEIKRGGGE